MTSIDIAVPNYNYGRYLESCIASIQAQEVERLRILIIDNASTDESAEIAKRLAASDPRIELRLRETNLGQHASFNEAVEWAAADCFAIVCSDDMLAPGALAASVAALEADRDVSLVYGRTQFLDGTSMTAPAAAPAARGETVDGTIFLERCCGAGRCPIGGPTAVVRTSAQKQAGFYTTALKHTDDVEMWMRLACLGKVTRIDADVLVARIHEGNQSGELTDVHRWNLEMERTFEAFFRGFGACLPEADALHASAIRSLADRAYLCAWSHAMRGEPGASALLAYALSRKPSLALMPPVGTLLSRGDTMQRLSSVVSALRNRFTIRPV